MNTAELKVSLIKRLMLFIDVMPDDYLVELVDQVGDDYCDWIEGENQKYGEMKGWDELIEKFKEAE